MTFTPTRAAGLAALSTFVPHAGRDYAETRNFDHGPADRSNVSMLSPYLRYRLVSEAEAVDAALARHTPAAAEKFVQEVLWRTYWKGALELRPSIWGAYRSDLTALDKQTGGWRRDYEKAIEGRTGIDCFDAWVGELDDHGYLHNHARMWFASIWIFTLRLPWQLGAEFFRQRLYDGDPASNTLSWRWVAGLQTVGKTYLARADNIARYTDGRFSPKGLAVNAPALSSSPLPKPRDLPPIEAATAGTAGLLIHEDDLTPETLPLQEVAIKAVAGLSGRSGRVDAVETFVDQAVGDACARASAAFGQAAAPGLDVPALRDWARAHALHTIVTAYAPVGPGATALAAAGAALAQDGVDLVVLRRDWDSAAWPHAQRGFFAFKERFVPA